MRDRDAAGIDQLLLVVQRQDGGRDQRDPEQQQEQAENADRMRAAAVAASVPA